MEIYSEASQNINTKFTAYVLSVDSMGKSDHEEKWSTVPLLPE